MQTSIPRASILDKLKQYDEQAPQDILDLSAQRQEDAFKKSKRLRAIFTSRAFWKGFWDVLTLTPLLRPHLRTPAKLLDDTAHESWRTVGNQLRSAIIKYMHVYA